MSKHIRPVQRQENSLVTKEGEFRTGIFEKGFREFNFQNYKRRFLKKLQNKHKLTEWQAVEVLGDRFFLIAAVFKFGPMNKALLIIHDRLLKRNYDFSESSFGHTKSHVAKTLENGDKSNRNSKKSYIEITNNLEKDELALYGYHKESNLSFEIDFKRISTPSVVSVQMGKNQYVYTEKDLLVPKGYIEFGVEREVLTEKHITIFDDHRGYYPLSSGYDWITTMGEIELNGVTHKFGLNITNFYKIEDEENINENGYWLDDEFYHLPYAFFDRSGDIWRIKDKFGMIDLTFSLFDKHTQKKSFPLKIDYTLAFGSIKGFIKSSEHEIEINDMFSLAEKRLTKLLFGKVKKEET